MLKSSDYRGMSLEKIGTSKPRVCSNGHRVGRHVVDDNLSDEELSPIKMLMKTAKGPISKSNTNSNVTRTVSLNQANSSQLFQSAFGGTGSYNYKNNNSNTEPD